MAIKIAFLEENKKAECTKYNVQSTLPSAGRQVQGTKYKAPSEVPFESAHESHFFILRSAFKKSIK
jgi:hypothetical protein